MSKFSSEVEDVIVTARISLLSFFPFFGQVSQHLTPRAHNGIPTACVTPEEKLYINPDFAAKCDWRDMRAVLAHEAMHIVTATCSRFPEGGDRELWNIASDAAINYLIFHNDCSGMALPREEVLVPVFGDQSHKPGGEDWTQFYGMTTEEIYNILKKDPERWKNSCQGQGDNPGTGSGDDDGQGSGKGEQSRVGGKPECCAAGSTFDEENCTPDKQIEWRSRVARAMDEARSQGKLPGVLSEWLSDVLKPKHDWRRELSVFASRSMRKRFTWKKPARRTAGVRGVCTPAREPWLP